ncbi:hypothetical protein AYR66_19350 [Noviherbaspirillum denitrificans]|uniref:Aminotransferase DegT n=1 Tax=Noviherbaspirillum denitrificans TaxID=1968433 RepID=A0A254TF98_9BURK|nr:hypothetical protein AYR66_19350 [Noviherbaspirillum denitrificans]
MIQSGWLAQGKEVAAFEDALCEFLGLPAGHAVAVSSGTAALFLALWVLGAKGKPVGLPVYACSALRNAIAMAGGEEILLDTGKGTPNIDLAQATSSKAEIIIAPHMFGIPMDLSEAGDKQLIEDCAQSLGAKVGGRRTGLQGKVGIYSFYATKMMTSGGQGGMLVSHDKSLVDAVRDYREFDCRHDRHRRFNFQMTDMQAAVGRVQLKRLPGFIERRAAIFKIYQEAGLNLLDAPVNAAGFEPVRYRAVIRTYRQGEILTALAENGVRAIVPIEDWELLGDGADYPHAWDMTKTTVSLPVFPALTDEQAVNIAACVKGLA